MTEEDYKREIIKTYQDDPRPWQYGQCRPGCWCGMVWPLNEDVNDTLDGVPSGTLSLNEARFLTLAHNIIPTWQDGYDVLPDWRELIEVDSKLDPRKWRYRHCFAVRQKKQASCWCREIIPVGRKDAEDFIVEGYGGAGLAKMEARLFVLMHNYIREYRRSDVQANTFSSSGSNG